MIRSILSTLVAVVILFLGAFYEQDCIYKSFDNFDKYIDKTIVKLNSENFSKEDSTALENYWLNAKKCLHIFIPHNEIKEIDLWISECVAYTKQNNFKEAVNKLEVLKVLIKEIPKTFFLTKENIF